MASVREEVRRVLLGFDANPARAEKLVAFLEADIPEDLPEVFIRELAEIRHEIRTFVDIEQIFRRAPGAQESGEFAPSNAARFRMYVRRIRAGGAGIAQEFLDSVRVALAQYGVASLEPGDALERAVLRMLSAQRDPALRYRLLLGVLRRVTALSDHGLDFEQDAGLSGALDMVARMRPQVGDALSDAALEASYRIYLQPGIEERAARTSRAVEDWLSSSETEFTVPPADVLREVAAAPRQVFDRVAHWITGDDPARREIALAAHTQRRYAPATPEQYSTLMLDGTRIHCAVSYTHLTLPTILLV